MTAIEVSSYAGLLAMGLLTLNILLGLLLSTRYNPVKQWPHRKIKIFQIHNWTGYSAFGVALLHPVILLASSTAGFKVLDILYPAHSPVNPLHNTLGAVALYLMAFVVATSYFRPQLGNRRWKKLHFATYALAAVFYLHGVLENPELKDLPTDFLDGEKVLIEGCALLVVTGIVWRVKFAPKPNQTKVS